VPITLLGSSDYSAQLAALLGLPFAFAAHFAPELLETAARLYRTRFVPSEVLLQPWLMVAVQVIAAGRDREAQRLFTTPQQRFLRLIRNQPVELLRPVESMDALWTDGERAAVKSRLRAAIVGSEATVEVGLRSLRASTGADEIIAVPIPGIMLRGLTRTNAWREWRERWTAKDSGGRCFNAMGWGRVGDDWTGTLRSNAPFVHALRFCAK
jgi:luciferase family oxidoreductase group 1